MTLFFSFSLSMKRLSHFKAGETPIDHAPKSLFTTLLLLEQISPDEFGVDKGVGRGVCVCVCVWGGL